MLKIAVASALLLLGFAALPALAQTRSEDCVNCAPQPQSQPQAYDTEAPARIRQEMDRRAPEAGAPAPAERATNYDRPAEPAPRDCANCPPPRHYDSTEVIKNSRDVDQSRVINTESVVQVPPRTRESNKLIVRENETRNVGVIQHNHRIIEKEIRYVRRAPAYRPAVPVYRAPRVQTVLVPVVTQTPCGCPCTCSGGHSGYAQAYTQAYVYADGAAYARSAPQPTTQYVLVPVDRSGGYAYR